MDGPETVTIAWTFTYENNRRTMWSRLARPDARLRIAALSLTSGVSNVHLATGSEQLPPEGEMSR
jgi:hypothetical protein